MPTSARVNERYEKRQVLGHGGMAVVWWAYDHVVQREVALKTIRDVRDKALLELFRKECATLASMAHPNIVEIFDVGTMEENGQEVPYFVMPLLRGATLDKLIETASERLTVDRCVDILLQVCRGLQAAHDHGLVHRDLKPSNIFVLQDDSAKIIDFGVAHFVDVHSTVKHGGTLLYMSPEQVMLKKPTPASDLFSLGVVAFEMMTRRRPFDGSSREDLAQRILSEIPAPAFQVNPAVSLPVSQVIHKAMAKPPYQRFANAKEFGDNLQKALRNEEIETFSASRIEPRIQRIRKAVDQGELEFAGEIISELESEALLHPELARLRKSLDEAVRGKNIQQLLETARRRFEEEEYQLALQKVQEVLNLDAANTEAHSLRGDIENKRSSQQIEDWLRLARQHMENHAYGHARQALQNVLQVRPKETQAQQLLSEVDRRELEYQKIRQEKENVYNAALEAVDKGDLSSALSKLERVLEMDRRAPDTFSPDRGAIYQKLYNQVRSDHDELSSSYQEARKQLENGDFPGALALCEEVLQRSPANALFQSLKFDIEDRQRQEVSAFVARIDREVDAEPDLNRKIRLLEDALARYPDESHFQRSLHTIRSKRELVDSIVSKARLFEEKEQYGEAQAQWEILRNIYRQYPGLDVETERISRRKQHKERADLKSRRVQQIDDALRAGDFSRALNLCEKALVEHPGDPELLTLQHTANQELERIKRAQEKLEQAETAFAAGDDVAGLELLREGNRLDPYNAPIRARLLDVLLGEAKTRIEVDWVEADQYLQQALDLDPGNAIAKSFKTLVQDKKKEQTITGALSRARALQSGGDLPQAVSVLDEALAIYPGEPRVTQLRSNLKRSQHEAEKAESRRRDLEELRAIQKEAETVFKTEALESLFARTQLLATRYGGDKEFNSAADDLRKRVDRSMQPIDDGVAEGAVRPSQPGDVPVLDSAARRNPPPQQMGQATQQAIRTLFAKAVAVLRGLPSTVPGSRVAWPRTVVPLLLLAGGGLLIFKLVQAVRAPSHSPQTAPPIVERAPPTPVPTAPVPEQDTLAPSPELRPAVQVMAEMDGSAVSLDGVPLEAKGRGLFALDGVSEGDHVLQVSTPDGANTMIHVRIAKGAMPEVLELKSDRMRAFVAAVFQGNARFFGVSPGEKVRAGLEDTATTELQPEGLMEEGLGTGPKVVFVQYGLDKRQHQVELTENASLFVSTAPDVPNGTLEIIAGGATDVQVFVNDRPRRFVPLRGNLFMGLIPGKLRVRVERAGYYPEEKAVDLKRGDLLKLNFELRPIPKVAKLLVRNAAGTEVSVGSLDPQRAGTDGTVSVDVNPGRHRIQITRQGFRPFVQDLDFAAGASREIDISKLTFERIAPITAEVIFQSTLSAPDIRVSAPDGRVTVPKPGVPAAYREGKYTVRASAPGYEDYSTQFEVKGSEPIVVPLDFKKIAEVAASPSAPAMSGWNNVSEWQPGPNGYFVKKSSGPSQYRSAAGTFSFTTPCVAKTLGTLFSRRDCTVAVFLIGGPEGELRYEITDKKLKRRGQTFLEKDIVPRISGEMRVRIQVTNTRTTLRVNDKEVDAVDGNYSTGKFGINSVDMIKDFRHSAN